MPGIAHTVLLHWDCMRIGMCWSHMEGDASPPSLSFLMRAGGPLKKSQIYWEPIPIILMMLHPVCPSWSVNRTCGSNSAFPGSPLAIPEMLPRHSQACTRAHDGRWRKECREPPRVVWIGQKSEMFTQIWTFKYLLYTLELCIYTY